MTRSQALVHLDQLTAALAHAPEFVRPASITVNPPSIDLLWDDFNRCFSRAESTYDKGWQRLSYRSGGVTWTTGRRLPDVEPREVTLPIAAEAALEV